MITVLLQGRTGNNFFQYAVGRYLAKKWNTDLELDLSWTHSSQVHQIRLIERLPLQAHVSRNKARLKQLVRRGLKWGPGKFHKGPIYSEPFGTTGYDPVIDTLTDGTLLDGYFQCPIFADSIRNALTSELDLAVLPTPHEVSTLLDTIRNCNSISLHVRRGDYLSLSRTQCLSPDYFQLGISHFAERFDDPKFFVFSDDIAWCRTQFTGHDFIFCNAPGVADDPYLDMRLMSACQHHIIVNSSFSWWGAWLNPSPAKTVIAPAKWMATTSSEGIVPKSWLRA